jgi:tellurium resistance protein TerD
MAISLSKGGNVSLTKTDPSLTRVLVGLGWDPRSTDGAAFDLDASAFLLHGNKVRSDKDFIFYNQLQSVDGSVRHMGDNRTGAGEGDDESIKVDLTKVPAEIDRIPITVTIYDAGARRQSFGQVPHAFIRIVNDETQQEIVRFDLSEDASTDTAMIFGELYRAGASEWKFRAVGQGYQGGLDALCQSFGVSFA